MEGVLNELTRTVHRREVGTPHLATTCGVSYHLDRDQLAAIPVERATTDVDVTKCGRCFDEAGGY